MIAEKKKDHQEKASSTNKHINPVRESSEEEMVQKIYKSMLHRVDIPKRFKNKTFSNFDHSRLEYDKNNPYFKVREYVDTFEERHKNGDWLVLTGGYGLGKTHLAIAAAREILKYFAKEYYKKHQNSTTYAGASDKIIFISSSDLLQDIKNSYDSKMISEKDVLSKYRTIPLLVLDDLGTSKRSRRAEENSWLHEKMYMILNHRYLQLLPTIVTTNLHTEELRKHISERVVERMIEAASNSKYLWKLQGESYRRSKK